MTDTKKPPFEPVECWGTFVDGDLWRIAYDPEYTGERDIPAMLVPLETWEAKNRRIAELEAALGGQADSE